MKRTIFYILTALLSMGMLTACGMPPHKTTDSPKRKIQVPTESPDLSAQNSTLAQEQARQLLADQDYVGTINLIQDKHREGINEQVLAKEYIQAANRCLGQADALMKKKDYPKAALLSKIVLDSYPESNELQQQIAASPTQLRSRINLCSEKLMEEGLIAYRSGKFMTAINVWEQLLAFNPEHQAAQSSIKTTQLQLSNLKSMNNKN